MFSLEIVVTMPYALLLFQRPSFLVYVLVWQVYDTVNSVVELMNKLAPPTTPGENRTLSEWFLRWARSTHEMILILLLLLHCSTSEGDLSEREPSP